MTDRVADRTALRRDRPRVRGRSSRFAGRATAVARALAAATPRASAPSDPRRILVAHHLLLGDTLMLTPLLKKLRTLHPDAPTSR